MKDHALVVVGSGIKFVSHLTTETKVHIEAADKILYLVNEPAMQAWLNQFTDAESLDDLYFKHAVRKTAYKEITSYILKNLEKYAYVCVVLYGHPTVYAKPALDAVILAKQRGYYAEILPAISAENCLFADLLINPGASGSLSVEATALLKYRKKIDISYHVIIWQIGVIDAMGHAHLHDNTKGIHKLFEYLKEFYDPKQEIILYQAAQYPGFNPSILRIDLHELPYTQFSNITTLYIPPVIKLNEEMDMVY
jgi:tetrapyrrole methylase family protein / MazG family protein